MHVLARTDARTCGDGCTYLRGRMHVLARTDLFTANVYDDRRKRLRGRFQTFAGAVANVCGNGCKRLRLRGAKMAPESSVLFWMREKAAP